MAYLGEVTDGARWTRLTLNSPEQADQLAARMAHISAHPFFDSIAVAIDGGASLFVARRMPHAP